MTDAAGPAPDEGPLRVLLVEDDDGDALLFEELLDEAGVAVDVQRASTVAEAQGVLPGHFACAVLDLGLPDADGLGALLEVRTAAPNLPVLVLTGLTDTEQGLAAVAAGAQDFLVKGRVDGEQLARSIRYAVQRQRAEVAHEELRAARLRQTENARLERGLLPRPIVADPRVRVSSGYRPGRERTLLGGDFFDVIEDEDGTLHAVVGDVCGHDPDAAALGVCLRIAWRTLVLGGRSPADVLVTLEQVLVHERLAEEIFATVCMVSIAPDRRSVVLRVAGHPLPILIDGASAARELPTPRHRPPLGLGLHGRWPGVTVDLPEAWRLLLYTDGLVEGRVGAGAERLGSERLVDLVTATAPDTADEGLIDALIATAERFNGGELTDDVAVLVLGGDTTDG